MPTTGKISYSDKGSSPECIVCLHGIGGDEKSFEPQINELSKIFRVISWNMPGYNAVSYTHLTLPTIYSV